MAYVLLVIEDDEETGVVNLILESDPPIDTKTGKATPAQYAGVSALKHLTHVAAKGRIIQNAEKK